MASAANVSDGSVAEKADISGSDLYKGDRELAPEILDPEGWVPVCWLGFVWFLFSVVLFGFAFGIFHGGLIPKPRDDSFHESTLLSVFIGAQTIAQYAGCAAQLTFDGVDVAAFEIFDIFRYSAGTEIRTGDLSTFTLTPQPTPTLRYLTVLLMFWSQLGTSA